MIRYTERPGEAGIEPSVGSKGDSYDNALAETIDGLYNDGLYNAELIYCCGPWKSMESAELGTLKRVPWFNHEQVKEPLGYIQPAEVEANNCPQLNSQAAIAA